MAKPQPQSEPQKAPYVTPKILTLKVDLSFASSATNLEDITDLRDRPQLTVPAKAEAPHKANKAAVGAALVLGAFCILLLAWSLT
jgi:hypothetical protein